MKYLRINLIKEVKDLYNENYKILKKGIEEDRKTSHVHELAEYCEKWLCYQNQSTNSM
jgi:hypothetical protein